MKSSTKRPRQDEGDESNTGKRTKKDSKQWIVPKKSQSGSHHVPSNIEPGDSGIWATCAMHKEGKCTGELRDLFNEARLPQASKEDPFLGEAYLKPPQYAARCGLESTADEVLDRGQSSMASEGIEADIAKELEGMRRPSTSDLFQAIRLDIKCGSFNVYILLDQVTSAHAYFSYKICTDAMAASDLKRTRWVQRLTPMAMMGKASEKGIEEVSKIVLAPHFHREDNPSKKFAIRTTIRNHTILKRDAVIKQVADAVGDHHVVDLHGYDLLILVEIYKNVCGMSVVTGDFDRLKRYNLAEIFDPTPKPAQTV
ncbi:hypothetical protein MMC09_002397 [Bachmanniomyces sp. S44760]|nr:hypothetical protein [Bachmanniomyces sp. S44760]